MPFPPKQQPPPQGQAPQQGQPPPPPQAPQPPTEEVIFSVPEKEPSKTDKVDWYVDVDFPPIVVKDIKPHFDALKVLSEMMPGTPEGKKMLLKEALTALGVNDIDQVLDTLFPPLPKGAKPTGPAPTNQPGVLQKGPPVKQVLGPGQAQEPPPAPGEPKQDAKPKEAESPLRVHRFLDLVEAARREAEGG